MNCLSDAVIEATPLPSISAAAAAAVAVVVAVVAVPDTAPHIERAAA